jgi:hypothetical protein
MDDSLDRYPPDTQEASMKEPPIRLGVYWQRRLLAVILCADWNELLSWRADLAPCGLFDMRLRPNAKLPLFLEMEV